jgi:phytoene dehydrogenase-like protein
MRHEPVHQEKVSPRVTKKQAILDYCRARKLQLVDQKELRAVQDELRCRLSPQDKTSLAYIASVLREAGLQVEYEDRYSDPIMQEPYASRLAGVLEFHDLASAERSLRKLDAVYRDYRDARDRVGMNLVRALTTKGKLRAQSLAANPRVQPQKRLEKQEISRWFQVWLETPDLLSDWLALRKSSEEFRALFGGGKLSDQ